MRMYKFEIMVVILVWQLCVARNVRAKYVHRVLSKDEVDDSLAVAETIRSESAVETKVNIPQFSKDDMQWYKRIRLDHPRFDAIGKLFILPFTKDRRGKFQFSKLFHFTAFYVAPDVLATAAHAFHMANITADSTQAIIFRQQYNSIAPYLAEKAREFERVVTAWIYSEEFEPRAQAKRNIFVYEDGYDFALLRTNAPSHGKNAFYILASADQYLADGSKKPHTPVRILGYPMEYSRFHEPAAVDCTLYTLYEVDERPVQRDLGFRFSTQADKDEKIKAVRENQLFCVGALGNMQDGGSGGPWLLGDSALSTEERRSGTGKARLVIGIQSWSFTRAANIDLKKLQEEQEFCKASASPWFTKTMVDTFKTMISILTKRRQSPALPP